jgi:NADH-quinone oxidoreductase subunit M
VVQRVFHGENAERSQLPDLSAREGLIVAPMIMGLLWLGLYPQPVLNIFAPAMHNLQRAANLPAVVWQR